MAEQKKNKKLKIILLVIAGGLAVYSLVIWFLSFQTLERSVTVVEKAAAIQSKNFRYYVQEYRTTKIALDEANKKVVDLTAELQAANAELSTTRGELSSVQGLNDELKQGIKSLEKYRVKAEAKGEAFEAMMSAFRKKNKQLDIDLQAARKELSFFQPDISDTDEGKAKIMRFKDHIRLVKKNMHAIKEQAMAIKAAAQQQRDRMEMLYGNNGYFIKDGKNQSLKRQGAQVDIKVEFK